MPVGSTWQGMAGVVKTGAQTELGLQIRHTGVVPHRPPGRVPPT